MKLSLFKRAALAAALSVPVGLAAPVVLGIGAPAAHATACVDVLPGPNATSNEIIGIAQTANPVLGVHGTQCNQNTDDSTVAINVCTSTTDPAVNGTGADLPPIDVWGNFSNPTGPYGVAEVGPVGIASEQTGC